MGPWPAGWHLECSAMATKYLGPAFDIHGGGMDLIFPHHENELAQSRAAGDGFARYWLHNGLLGLAGEKMSKSEATRCSSPTCCRRVRPAELRYYLVQAHYRSLLEYSQDALEEAVAAYQRIERFVVRASEALDASGMGPPRASGSASGWIPPRAGRRAARAAGVVPFGHGRGPRRPRGARGGARLRPGRQSGAGARPTRQAPATAWPGSGSTPESSASTRSRRTGRPRGLPGDWRPARYVVGYLGRAELAAAGGGTGSRGLRYGGRNQGCPGEHWRPSRTLPKVRDGS